jgi:hypothetical protein
MVPVPPVSFAAKNLPPTPGAAASPAKISYYYGDAYQYAVAAGLSARFTQHKPTLGQGDSHTLMEVAAQSADGQQIVEIGWTVDPGVNGDNEPHLFVYHWVDRVPSCYNGCGWVQVSNTRMPGMKVQVTSDPQEYVIQFLDGNWWIGYQGEWMGYFPGSLWNGSYTQIGLGQWFGEVCASRLRSCTDMGSGVMAGQPGAAEMRELLLRFEDNQSLPADAQTQSTRPQLWDIKGTDGATFTVGGPGGC